MSTRDEVKSGILVYTCNCGWLDTGHANPTSYRPDELVVVPVPLAP